MAAHTVSTGRFNIDSAYDRSTVIGGIFVHCGIRGMTSSNFHWFASTTTHSRFAQWTTIRLLSVVNSDMAQISPLVKSLTASTLLLFSSSGSNASSDRFSCDPLRHSSGWMCFRSSNILINLCGSMSTVACEFSHTYIESSLIKHSTASVFGAVLDHNTCLILKFVTFDLIDATLNTLRLHRMPLTRQYSNISALVWHKMTSGRCGACIMARIGCVNAWNLLSICPVNVSTDAIRPSRNPIRMFVVDASKVTHEQFVAMLSNDQKDICSKSKINKLPLQMEISEC